MKIGDRIKARREELEMSQEELAKRLGYSSRSSITKIEKDASGLPQPKIAAIASALKTTPSYIMGWEEEEKSNDILTDIVKKAMQDKRLLSILINLYEIKKNDTLEDVIKRMRTDEEFVSVVAVLVKLNEKQLQGVKNMLDAFLK